MKIDIERLIDAVTAENEAYNEYCHSSKTLYRGPFEEITARKNHVNYAREVHDRERNAVDTLAEVFQMDAETRNRLYIAARAVIISTLELRRWGKALDHAKIIARLLFSLFSPLLIQNMPITGVRDAERTLKQRKIRTH